MTMGTILMTGRRTQRIITTIDFYLEPVSKTLYVSDRKLGVKGIDTAALLWYNFGQERRSA